MESWHLKIFKPSLNIFVTNATLIQFQDPHLIIFLHKLGQMIKMIFGDSKKALEPLIQRKKIWFLDLNICHLDSTHKVLQSVLKGRMYSC